MPHYFFSPSPHFIQYGNFEAKSSFFPTCWMSQVQNTVTACGPLSQVPSVRSGRKQGPKKEISVLQLQRGSVGAPVPFSKQRMLRPRSSLQALQLLSGSGGQRLSPILGPAQDMLLRSGPSALFFPRPNLEQFSLLSVPRFRVFAYFGSFSSLSFPPNAFGSLPSSSIVSKFTIPVPLSFFPHSISVSMLSPPGPCPRQPQPFFLEKAFAFPWIDTYFKVLVYEKINQKVLVWGASFLRSFS